MEALLRRLSDGNSLLILFVGEVIPVLSHSCL